jgi:hypothetical protein
MPASVPSVPSIKGKVARGIRAPIAAAGGTSTYIQSDNTKFFQPDGSSLYLIP